MGPHLPSTLFPNLKDNLSDKLVYLLADYLLAEPPSGEDGLKRIAA